MAETVSYESFNDREITYEYRYDFDSENRVTKITKTYTASADGTVETDRKEYTITYAE